MTTIRVPGKLYLAGEYAVTYPGQPAIIIAVNRFLRLNVATAVSVEGTFYSEGYTSDAIPISRSNDRPHLPATFELVGQTLQLVERYLRELGQTIQPYDLHITTELELHGKKIGLGSSGAVTVALIQGILDWHDVPHPPLLIYKLAALVHLLQGSRGSFGDLAACSFTGCIRYCSPDRQAILELYRRTQSLTDILDVPWPALSIKQLHFPANCHLLVGWTNEPAITEQLITQPKKLTASLRQYFLKKSQQCISQLTQGIQKNNYLEMTKALIDNRALLQWYAEQRQMIIETPMLETLCNCAVRFGAAAKASGAGGGDCGIALVADSAQIDSIMNCWQCANIIPLNLTIYDRKDN